MKALKQNSEGLLRFLRHRLVTPSDETVVLESDQESMVYLTDRNRLQPLLHTLRGVEDDLGLDDTVLESYRNEAHRRMLFGNQQIRHALAFVEALQEAGVPCICMRGPFASQDLYGDPGIRPYNDIDLLVPRGCAMEAWGVAKKLRYELFSRGMPVKYFLRHHLHWQLRQPEQNVICDLHWAVDHPYRMYRIDYEAIFAEARRVESPFGSWMEPHPMHHLILTALHVRKHVEELYTISQQPDGVAVLVARGEVLHLIDAALLLQRHGQVLDWDRLGDVAADWNAEEAVVGCLALVQRAFGVSVPQPWFKSFQSAIPAWRLSDSSIKFPAGNVWAKALSRSARVGGFRAEKVCEAGDYLFPPAELFGAEPGFGRWLRRRSHQFFAAARLGFAGIDTAVATSVARVRMRYHNNSTSG